MGRGIGVSAYRRGQKRVGVWAFGKDTKPLVNMEVALEQELFNTFENNVVVSVDPFRKLEVYQEQKAASRRRRHADTPTRQHVLIRGSAYRRQERKQQ